MKRSSMLRKLTILLRSWEGSQLTGETSKEILDLIEKNGMLPPQRYRPHDWNERGITYSDWLQLSRKVIEWEPENE